MKSVSSCFILSNGTLLIAERPCLKSFLTYVMMSHDSVNHPLWSNLVGEPKTEVSEFINKFNVKNSHLKIK